MLDLNVIPPAIAGGIDNGYSYRVFLNQNLKKAIGNIRRSAIAELLRSSIVFHLLQKIFLLSLLAGHNLCDLGDSIFLFFPLSL